MKILTNHLMNYRLHRYLGIVLMIIDKQSLPNQTMIMDSKISLFYYTDQPFNKNSQRLSNLKLCPCHTFLLL